MGELYIHSQGWRLLFCLEFIGLFFFLGVGRCWIGGLFLESRSFSLCYHAHAYRYPPLSNALALDLDLDLELDIWLA